MFSKSILAQVALYNNSEISFCTLKNFISGLDWDENGFYGIVEDCSCEIENQWAESNGLTRCDATDVYHDEDGHSYGEFDLCSDDLFEAVTYEIIEQVNVQSIPKTIETVIFACGKQIVLYVEFSQSYGNLIKNKDYTSRKVRNKNHVVYKLKKTHASMFSTDDHSPMPLPENIVQLADFVRKNSSDDQVRRFFYGHFDTDETFDAVILPFAR